MNAIHTTQLSLIQKQQLVQLVTLCQKEETLSLSAPQEDGLEYFLLYEDETLVSMVFLFFPEESICECGAFTLPSRRKEGFFSQLLEEALDFLEALEAVNGYQVDFCLIADAHTPSASAVLKTMGAEFWYSEYKLERSLTSDDQNYTAALSIRETEEHIYTASLNDKVIGTCITLPSETTVYVYGFEILEALRGQGYGNDFLLGMISILASDYLKITLQVSGRNAPALSLYKKTGFRICETLSYYLY